MPMTPYMAVNELRMSLHFLRIPQGVYSIVTSFYAFPLKNSRKGPCLACGHTVSPAENTEVAIFPIASYEKPIASTGILSNIYVKNTLRIDPKQRLPCFCRYYGANFEKSLAL